MCALIPIFRNLDNRSLSAGGSFARISSCGMLNFCEIFDVMSAPDRSETVDVELLDRRSHCFQNIIHQDIPMIMFRSFIETSSLSPILHSRGLVSVSPVQQSVFYRYVKIISAI